MKKIFALLLGALSACSVAAQSGGIQRDAAQGTAARSDITPPTLPPMEEPGAWQNFGPQAPPILRMRGMEIDDGYGELSPYGAARLFGGTPAHDFYMDGLRYRRVSAHMLWWGVGLSAMGLLTLATEIGRGSSDGMEREYRNSVVGAGATMLAVGVPLTAIGVVFRNKAKRSLTRAVDVYNEYTRSALHDTRTPELSVGFMPGGIGLAYSF